MILSHVFKIFIHRYYQENTEATPTQFPFIDFADSILHKIPKIYKVGNFIKENCNLSPIQHVI